MDVRLENPAGLTGVWAEENTRASIWDAMYRKETFGVSGPHIKVRFFGGWGYNKNIFDAQDWVTSVLCERRADGRRPAAMTQGQGGSDLRRLGGQGSDLRLISTASRSSRAGRKNGQSFEKIFDVAWSGDRKADKWTGRVPAIQSTVDLEKATYTNTVGSTELKTVWTDPEFDSSLHAFYYARVLEIPTPRWTLIQAVKAGHSAARCRAADGAGTRLELAHLVHAQRRSAQERPSRE